MIPFSFTERDFFGFARNKEAENERFISGFL